MQDEKRLEELTQQAMYRLNNEILYAQLGAADSGHMNLIKQVCSFASAFGLEVEKAELSSARREERIKALEEAAQMVLSHKWVGHPKYGDQWNSALEEAAEDIRQKVREINAKA